MTSILDRELALWLYTCMKDPDEGVRKTAAGAYMHLNLAEWVYLLRDSTTDHLKGLLERTTPEGEKKAGVRCNCIKAVSSMCARVLVSRGEWNLGGMDEGIVTKVIKDVSEAVLKVGNDENVNVKCMVMLAMGNLGQGLGNLIKGRGEGGGMEVPAPWEELCECVVSTLGEEDERVAASGIRAIGHLYSSYLKCRGGGREAGEKMREVQRKTFEDLDARILRAVQIERKVFVGLNSKQRYSSNKHAWGACHR